MAEDLDSLSLIISAELASELFIADRYNDALRPIRKAMKMDPELQNLFRQVGLNR